MPYNPTRKKLEKKQSDDDIGIKTHTFYCCCCGLAFSKQRGYFPISRSKLYKGSGFLPFCNNCTVDLYRHYKKKLETPERAMKRLCMKLDLFWDRDVYMALTDTKDDEKKVNLYISKLNMVQYQSKSYDDTIEEDIINGLYNDDAPDYIEYKEDGEVISKNVPPELIEFWGAGFDYEFYMEADKKYHDWTGGIDRDLDPGEISIYKQICMLEVIIAKDAADGKPIDKNINTLNTLLGSANLKPAQKKEDNDNAFDKTPMGVWIKRWEDNRPIPDPDPEFKDPDGIIKYISIWFLGHLCSMLNIKNTYCELYEKKMAEMRIDRPEFDDEDNEVLFNDIFGTKSDD